MDGFVEDFVNGGPAPIGHNNPPSNADPLAERLRELAAPLLANRDETFLPAAERWDAERPEIADDEQEAAATEFVRRAKVLARKFDEMRVQEKETFLNGGRIVDSTFKGFVAPLADAITALDRKIAAYKKKKLDAQRKEQERLAEAARKATAEAKTVDDMKEAAQLATAAVAPIEPLRSRSDGGALSTGTIVYVPEVVDIDQVPREFLSYDERKVKAYQNGLPKGTVPVIPGIKFTETVKNTYRG